MSEPSIYLITGANRGIGRGFTQRIVQKPSTTVIAAVRDPAHPTTKSLLDLVKGPNSRLIIVKLDSAIATDAADAVAQLRDQGIAYIDIVIANAGIFVGGTSVRETSAPNALQHFSVNAIGPLTLFQATADLLKASKTGTPRFVAISSFMGSIGSQENFAQFPEISSPYGASKAALNWFIRLLSFEEPWLTAWVFHPGFVDTNLAANGPANASDVDLKAMGAVSADATVADMVKTTFAIEPKEINGTFRTHDGSVIPW